MSAYILAHEDSLLKRREVMHSHAHTHTHTQTYSLPIVCISYVAEGLAQVEFCTGLNLL